MLNAKWLAFAACAWECAAVSTGRVPTFTALSRTRPWLRGALVTALAVHLYRQERRPLSASTDRLFA